MVLQTRQYKGFTTLQHLAFSSLALPLWREVKAACRSREERYARSMDMSLLGTMGAPGSKAASSSLLHLPRADGLPAQERLHCNALIDMFALGTQNGLEEIVANFGF